MNQRDLIHKWAHGLNDATSGAAVYTTGGILLSYGFHFPLGIRCGQIEGRPAYLLNSRSYGVATSKHQSWTSGATHHGERLFVPMFGDILHSAHELRSMIEAMEREQKAGERSTLSRGPRKRADGEQAAHRITQTAARLPLFLKGAGVKLDREQAARLRKLAAWTPADPVALAARIEADRISAERKAKRIEAKNRRDEAADLATWKAGGESKRRYFTELALRDADGVVQTTHGAQVPTDAAHALWLGWIAGKDIVGRHVGPYTVNEVTPDAIVIGCHTIDKGAASDLARRMNW